MGLDPVLETLPERYKSSMSVASMNGIVSFFEEIFNEMKTQNVLPAAFKPNQGFYIKHNKPRDHRFEGSIALGCMMDMIQEFFPGIPVILDYKRGDIAKSSANYAAEGFECWKADGVTVFPYMGTDSVEPFAKYCNDEQGKGVYVLNRTSNSGAKDLQNLCVIGDAERIGNAIEEKLRKFLTEPIAVRDEELLSKWILASDENNFVRKNMREMLRDAVIASSDPLYKVVAQKIVDWSKDHPGVGAVVGATSLDELSNLAKFYTGKNIPLLIPGVDGQGGKADEAAARLRDAGYDLSLARINSSSGLIHPWAKKKEPAPEDFAKVCVEKLHILNEQIGYKP
jgi:orotidine-5'-phosphate decarboxylase